MSDNMYTISITILAPTPESAKELVVDNIKELIKEAEVEKVD